MAQDVTEIFLRRGTGGWGMLLSTRLVETRRWAMVGLTGVQPGGGGRRSLALQEAFLALQEAPA